MVPRAIMSVQPQAQTVTSPIPTPQASRAFQKGKRVGAADIPGLKERFLSGALQDGDWDDMVEILDAAQARRQRNKSKQADWRAKQKEKAA